MKAKDGVRIACWAQVEGKPLLRVPAPQWGVTTLWQLPEPSAFYGRLARGRRHVNYNARGTGQSDRGVADYSLEVQVGDLEAVADRLAGANVEPMGAMYGAVEMFGWRAPKRST